MVTYNLWTENHTYIGVVDGTDDDQNNKDKEVAYDFGWSHRKSSRHFETQ